MWSDGIYLEQLTGFQNYWTCNSFLEELNPTQIFIELNPNVQNNSSKMFHIFGLDQNPCQNCQTSMKDFLETMNEIFGFLALIFNLRL